MFDKEKQTSLLMDSVDRLEEGKFSDFKDSITGILESKLEELSTEHDLIESDEDEEINEAAKTVVKVNSKGERRRKMVCGAGKKLVNGVCVLITGSEKLNMKKGALKAKKTKKNLGAGYALKVQKKQNKAMKKRQQQGL